MQQLDETGLFAGLSPDLSYIALDCLLGAFGVDFHFVRRAGRGLKSTSLQILQCFDRPALSPFLPPPLLSIYIFVITDCYLVLILLWRCGWDALWSLSLERKLVQVYL